MPDHICTTFVFHHRKEGKKRVVKITYMSGDDMAEKLALVPDKKEFVLESVTVMRVDEHGAAVDIDRLEIKDRPLVFEGKKIAAIAGHFDKIVCGEGPEGVRCAKVHITNTLAYGAEGKKIAAAIEKFFKGAASEESALVASLEHLALGDLNAYTTKPEPVASKGSRAALPAPTRVPAEKPKPVYPPAARAPRVAMGASACGVAGEDDGCTIL